VDNGLSVEWHAVCEKWSREGFDALSHPEKVWLVIRGLIDATNNGGLASYFYNSTGDHYLYCLQALDDAVAVKDQVTAIGHLFGDSVPEDSDQRNNIIDDWDGEFDEKLDEIDEAILPLLDALDGKLQYFLETSGCLKP